MDKIRTIIDILRESNSDNTSMISLLSQIESKKSKSCEYCSEENTTDNLRGHNGIVNNDKNSAYIYIEHFRNEKYKIDVNYCPMCGKKL